MKSYLNRRRVFWLLFLLLTGGMSGWLLIRFDASQGSVILTDDRPQAQKSRIGFLGPWSYPLRGWLLRVKSRLLGPPAAITLDLQLLDLARAPGFTLTNAGRLSADLAQARGLRGWVLSPADLTVLTQRLTSVASLISRPRLVTSSAQSAQLSVAYMVSVPQGPTPTGIFVDFLPHARRESLEVFTFITLSEAVTNHLIASMQPPSLMIQTNLAVGVRLQMPPGHGAFLLHSNRENGKVTGVLLTPSVHWPKR